jgi:hypothetical protein
VEVPVFASEGEFCVAAPGDHVLVHCKLFPPLIVRLPNRSDHRGANESPSGIELGDPDGLWQAGRRRGPQAPEAIQATARDHGTQKYAPFVAFACLNETEVHSLPYFVF